MTKRHTAYRLLTLLLFVLMLSLSTSPSVAQASTTTALLTHRVHTGNLFPLGAGTVTEYPIPTFKSQPVGITSGPDGNLWFTESNANKIGKVDLSAIPLTIVEYPLPNCSVPCTANSQPEGITKGPDGNLWFTEFSRRYGHKIGKITTSGTITEYPLLNANSEPESITSGPDGNLWFTEFSGNQIGMITTSGTITEYAIPTADSQPEGITKGLCQDGTQTQCLWFAEYLGRKIGRLIPGLPVQFSEYSLSSSNARAIDITSGPDGNIWFTEQVVSAIVDVVQAYIGEVTSSPVKIIEFRLPIDGCIPNGITAGSDGKLWFTEYFQIGTITTDGQHITQYPLLSLSSGFLPDHIVSGPDGNLWFTEFSGNNIGEITTQ